MCEEEKNTRTRAEQLFTDQGHVPNSHVWGTFHSPGKGYLDITGNSDEQWDYRQYGENFVPGDGGVLASECPFREAVEHICKICDVDVESLTVFDSVNSAATDGDGRAIPEAMEGARIMAARCLEALKKIGYQPEVVLASGGNWDGIAPLVSEKTRAMFGGFCSPVFGQILTLEDCDRIAGLEGVRPFVEEEESKGYVPYAVIVDHMAGEDGIMTSVLCIDSSFPEDWESNLSDLYSGLGFAVVESPCTGDTYDIGRVAFKVSMGGLIRTA